MSYASINRAMQDQDLIARVTSAALKEAYANPEFGDTIFGGQVKMNPRYGGDVLIGPVAVDTEAAYASALAAGRGAPGHDTDVITDAAINSAVQAHWPADPEPPAP